MAREMKNPEFSVAHTVGGETVNVKFLVPRSKFGPVIVTLSAEEAAILSAALGAAVKRLAAGGAVSI